MDIPGTSTKEIKKPPPPPPGASPNIAPQLSPEEKAQRIKDGTYVESAEEKQRSQEKIELAESKGMMAGDVNESIDRSDPIETDSNPDHAKGREVTVKIPKGNKIKVRYLLIPRQELVVSHDNDFKENPEYPGEIQNRDRGKGTNKEQVLKIEAKLDPDEVMESYIAKDGAPIVFRDKNGRYIVLSGNGRTMGINRRADLRGEESMADYEQALKDNLDRFGFDANTDTKGKVLVRSFYGSEDLVEMATMLNTDTGQRLSTTEQASSDATEIANAARKGNNIMSLLNLSDGDIMGKSNEAFVKAFFDLIVAKQSGGYITRNGKWTTDLRQRIQYAMFAYVMNAEKKAEGMLESFTEDGDSNVKNLIWGILDNLQSIIKLRFLIEENGLLDLDISQTLLDAITEISRIRKMPKIDLESMLNETDLFSEGQEVIPDDKKELYKLLYYLKSRKAAREFLAGYYALANEVLSPEEDTIFASSATSKDEMLNKYIEEWNNERPKATPRTNASPKGSDSTDNPGSESQTGAEGDDSPGTRFSQISEAEALKLTTNIDDRVAEDALKAMLGKQIQSITRIPGTRSIEIKLKNGNTVILNRLSGLIMINGKPRGIGETRSEITETGNVRLIIDLVDGYNGGNRTLFHEGFHMVWKLFLNPEQRQFIARYLSKKINSTDIVDIEEAAADSMEAFIGGREDQVPGMIRNIWRNVTDKIRSFLVKIGFATNKMKLTDIFVKGSKGELEGKGEAYEAYAMSDQGIRHKALSEDEIPQKTITVVRMGVLNKDGSVSPVMVDTPKTREKYQIGTWYKAEGRKSNMADRWGFHGGEVEHGASFTQLYKEDGTLESERVYYLAEMAADVDWQPIAQAAHPKNVRKQDIRGKVPEGGFYRYYNNGKKKPPWIVSGAMKAIRILSMAEVDKMNLEAGRETINGYPKAKYELKQAQSKAKQEARRAKLQAKMEARQAKLEAKLQAKMEAKNGKRYKVLIESQITDKRDIVNPINPNLSDEQKIIEMKKLRDEAIPVFRELLETINSEMGLFTKDDLKDDKKAIDKTHRPAKEKWYSLEHLTDYYRGTAVVTDLSQIIDITKMILAKNMGIVDFDYNKIIEPTDFGYQDIAFVLRMPNGLMVEFQLILEEINIAKKELHKYYEKWREFTREQIIAMGRWEEHVSDRSISREGYNNALSSALSRLGISKDEYIKSFMNSLTRAGLSTYPNNSSVSSMVMEEGPLQTPEADRVNDVSRVSNNTLDPLRSTNNVTSDSFMSTSTNKIAQKSDNATKSQEIFAPGEGITKDGVRYKLAKAYHGTGKLFNRFDLNYVGTGEGAQAFGWGLYVSENWEVAKSYAEKIGGTKLYGTVRIGDFPIVIEDKSFPNDIDRLTLALLKDYKKRGTPIDNKGEAYGVYQRLTENLNKPLVILNHEQDAIRVYLWDLAYVLLNDSVNNDKDMAHGIYQNNLDGINAEIEYALTETFKSKSIADKAALTQFYTQYIEKQAISHDPFRQSGNRVVYELSVWENHEEDVLGWRQFVPDEQLDKINKQLTNEGHSTLDDNTLFKGQHLYHRLQNSYFNGDAKAASQFLLRAGIDGIKYPVEALSGGTGEKGFNYVVFDDSQITIQGTERYKQIKTHTDQWMDGTGDIVTGDIIRFEEAVWGGSISKPKKLGSRTVEAIVTKDSYGKDKQQHTFSIEVIKSEGYEPLAPGTKTTRKGRNIYRNGTERLIWKDEAERDLTAQEKHSRGGIARSERDKRREEGGSRYKQFGENFPKLKGNPISAFNHLMEVKHGQVIGAYIRTDIGEIDLVWGMGGSKGYGLAHILEKHPNITAQIMKDIIEKGEATKHNHNNTVNLKYNNGRAGVRLDWDGEHKVWVVTAFIDKSLISTETSDTDKTTRSTNETIPDSDQALDNKLTKPDEMSSERYKLVGKDLDKLSQDTPSEAQIEAVRKQYEGTDQWMKSPNGKPTKLNERQWLQVRTPAFKAWFGDWLNDPKNASKVIDENGEPMVVYHGTNTRKIGVFSAEKMNETFNEVENYVYPKDGFWFARERQSAKGYATYKTGREGGRKSIYSVFLNIRTPISISAEDVADEGLYSVPSQYDINPKNNKPYMDTNDGIDIPLTRWVNVDGKMEEYDRYYVAFTSTQIKSATANVGTFDPKNPDIRYKLVPEAVNRKFNEEIEQYFQGKIDKYHVFEIGKPGSILSISGFPNLPIHLLQGTISKKAEKHSLEKESLLDLPMAINDPLFVMESITHPQTRLVVFTELYHPEGNVLLAAEIDTKHNNININKVISVYGKDNDEVMNWIIEYQDDEKFRFLNKEKCLIWSRSSRRSNSPSLSQLTQAIDKINESVGLSSPKFAEVREKLQKDSDTRFKQLNEDIVKRMEAAKRMIEKHNRDAEAISEEVAEMVGMDPVQVKEKLGRQIRAAYREANEQLQTVMASAAISGFDKYVDTNKPDDKEDLTLHHDQSIDYAQDMGLSAEEAMVLGADRYTYYFQGLKMFSRANAIMEDLVQAQQQQNENREKGITDDNLQERIVLLTGMVVQARLQYDNMKGNAGRLLRHAREQKGQTLREFTRLAEVLQDDTNRIYKELAELRAELKASEEALAALEKSFDDLLTVTDHLQTTVERMTRHKSNAPDDIEAQKAEISNRINEMNRKIEGIQAKINDKIESMKASQAQAEAVQDYINKIKPEKIKPDSPKPPKPPRIIDIPLIPVTWYDIAKSAMYQGMLSSPMTHFRNIIGNVSNLAAEQALNILTDPIGGIQSIIAAGEAIGGGIKAASKTFLDASEYFKKYDMSDKNSKILKILSWVTRTLAAEDQFFYHLAYTSQVTSLAHMEAKRTKQSFASLVKHPSQDMIKQAAYEARRATFNHNPEGIIGLIVDAIEKSVKHLERYEGEPLLKSKTGIAVASMAPHVNRMAALAFKYSVMPFTRVVANVTNFGIDWSPLGLIRSVQYAGTNIEKQRKVWEGKGLDPDKSPYARRDVTRQIGRALTGTIAMLIAQALLKGIVSGGGPRDKEKRRQLMETGWRQYSIKIGNRWIPYNDYWMGTIFAIIGNYNDYNQYNRGKKPWEGEDALSYALMGVVNTFLDKSFLRGLGDTFEAIARQDENHLKRLAGNAPGTFLMPNGIRMVNDVFYTRKHKPETTAQYMLYNFRPITTPILKANIPTTIDVLGREEKRTPYRYQIIGSPIQDKQPLLVFDTINTPIDIREVVNAITASGERIPGSSNYELKIADDEYISLRGFDRQEYLKQRGREVSMYLVDYKDTLIQLSKRGDSDRMKDVLSRIASKSTRTAKHIMVEQHLDKKLKHSYKTYNKKAQKGEE